MAQIKLPIPLRIIPVPGINARLTDFGAIAVLWKQVQRCRPGDNVHFTFAGCGYLRPHAIVSLGTMIRVLEARGAKPVLRTATMREAVRTNLELNGFARSMGSPVLPTGDNAICYREDPVEDKDGIVAYLRNEWLGRGWLNISDPLTNLIVGQLWEAYANAFEHSGSPVGVHSCGEHFPEDRSISLAIADAGVTIPVRIRDVVSESIDPVAAMQWAFTPGKTTADPNKKIARGLGLDILKTFIRDNNGSMEVLSNSSYVKIDAKSERYAALNVRIPGTLVHITLVCDDRLYDIPDDLASNDAPYF